MTPDQERELTEVFAAWRVMLAQTTPDAAGKCIAMLRDLRGHIETVLTTCLPAAPAGN